MRLGAAAAQVNRMQGERFKLAVCWLQVGEPAALLLQLSDPDSNR